MGRELVQTSSVVLLALVYSLDSTNSRNYTLPSDWVNLFSAIFKKLTKLFHADINIIHSVHIFIKMEQCGLINIFRSNIFKSYSQNFPLLCIAIANPNTYSILPYTTKSYHQSQIWHKDCLDKIVLHCKELYTAFEP